MYNFEEQRSLALVNAVVKLINTVETKAKLADAIATKLTILRRDFLSQGLSLTKTPSTIDKIQLSR